MNAIEKIEAQQAKLKPDTAPWVVGEQLKEICLSDKRCAELVSADLDGEAMSLVNCEKKIKAYADAHKQGSFAYVSPKVAEGIIREFYGLPSAGEASQTPATNVLSIEDFM